MREPVEGRISSPALRTLQRLQELPDFATSSTLSISPETRAVVGATLRRYLQGHVEGLRYLKAESVLSAMME
jgi:hypothetical protein